MTAEQRLAAMLALLRARVASGDDAGGRAAGRGQLIAANPGESRATKNVSISRAYNFVIQHLQNVIPQSLSGPVQRKDSCPAADEQRPTSEPAAS